MIDLKDVRIDTFTSGIKRPTHMRIVHMPTGLVVEGIGKSQYRLRQELLASLEKEIEKHNSLLDSSRICS